MLQKNRDLDLVICGSIALDSVQTPFGRVGDALGGSATYSSLAAAHFISPALVSIVGHDFPKRYLRLLKQRKIGLEGLLVQGKTFRWEGLYEFDMNEAKTLKTKLNCLETFKPCIPDSYTKTKFLFLANMDPSVQGAVAKKCPDAFVILDTMNFYIQNKKAELVRTVKLVDVVILNDAEARELCNEVNLIKAGRQILKMGPKYVVIKKGEHGALLFGEGCYFSAPGYPLEKVKDPTGAGDSFAGAFAGYLASHGQVDEPQIRRAVIYGSAVASFCAEDFSVKNLIKIDKTKIKERYEIFKKIREF